jgi:chromatin structure-remodeling complex protein RSC7
MLNGIYDPHTNIMQYPKIMQPTHAKWVQIDDYEVKSKGATPHDQTSGDEPTIFPPVDPILSRNYMVVDIIYESAPASNLGVPGPDGGVCDIGFNGLADISDDIKADLPPECLRAFEEALEKERSWKSNWGLESQNGFRRAPKIDKGPMV